MRKILIYALTLFLFINFTEGLLMKTYHMVPEDGASGTDVTAVWLTCSNLGCTETLSNPASNIWNPNPIFLGSTTSLTDHLPDCPETNFGYIYFFLKIIFKPKQYPLVHILVILTHINTMMQIYPLHEKITVKLTLHFKLNLVRNKICL